MHCVLCVDNRSKLFLGKIVAIVARILWPFFLTHCVQVPTKDLPKSSDDIVEEEADTRGTNSKDLEAELENDVEAGEEEEGEGYKFDADRNLTASKIQFGSDHPNIGEEPSIHHEGIDQKKKRQGVYSQYREDASHSSQIISVQIVGGARLVSFFQSQVLLGCVKISLHSQGYGVLMIVSVCKILICNVHLLSKS